MPALLSSLRSTNPAWPGFKSMAKRDKGQLLNVSAKEKSVAGDLSPLGLPPLDKEGFLRNLEDWSAEVAKELARHNNINLTKDHWEILDLVRAYYQRYNLSPAMRALVKAVEKQLGKEKGRSIYLMMLFPGKTARLISLIAGLPKPDNCD